MSYKQPLCQQCAIWFDTCQNWHFDNLIYQLFLFLLLLFLFCFRQLSKILNDTYGLSVKDASSICTNFLKTFRKCPEKLTMDLDTWRLSLWSQALGDDHQHLTGETNLQNFILTKRNRLENIVIVFFCFKKFIFAKNISITSFLSDVYNNFVLFWHSFVFQILQLIFFF